MTAELATDQDGIFIQYDRIQFQDYTGHSGVKMTPDLYLVGTGNVFPLSLSVTQD